MLGGCIMLSRNNWKEQVRQQEPKKQRFTIKKLTIGVASVLIGFTFMGMSASADDQTTPTTSDPAVTPTKVQSNNNPSMGMSASADDQTTPTTSDPAVTPTKVQSNNNPSAQTAQSGATSYYNNALSLYAIGDSDDSTDSHKYQVSYFPMNFNRPTTDTPVTKAQTPMLPYMMPDGTITGYKLTGDTHGAPFNPPKGLTASVDSKTGKLTVTVAKDVTTDDFNIIVSIDYQDGSGTNWFAPVHIKNYADQYIPAYKDTKVAANSSVNTGSPSFTKDSNPVTDVPGHTYAFKDGTTKMTINDKNSKNPVTVTIDKTSGAITFTAPDDATEYDIPVTVTYEDSSSNTATAKVFVNKSLDPTKVDPTNPEYKEMFKTVTRDIVTTSVSGQQTTEAQSLDFGRTMTIYGNGDPATYGKWEALSADKFASENITPVDGYTSYYKIGNDGQKVYASAVPSASALDKDDNPVDGTTVYVGYDKSNADQYIPAYKDTTVAANSSVNTVSPSFTKDSKPVTDVPGHTYAFNDGTTKMTINDKNGKNPVTVTIDKTSGAITFTAPDDATEYDIPVTVTYEDSSSNTATAKVFVNKSLDPTKVDPTNPEYKEMFKTVTRDIVTTSVSGQQTTEAQSLDFGRTMTIYGNGDPATYGKWEALSADKFASENITPVDGYTSYYKIGNDGQKVYASAVPSASALDKDDNPIDGTTVYVGYDKNYTPTPTPTKDTTVTYTFYDKTDKKPVEGHDVTVTGQPGTDQKVNLTTPEGYKLAEGQTLPTSVTMPKGNETITINLVHATKDIKPNDPGVNPSDPAYADMFKTVTRTIKVNNPDRMVNTTTQQVNFNRTKTIDEVTDEVISYGNWTLATGSAKNWGQFNVPQLDGFISYVDGNAAKEVAEENVTADTADVTVEVTYKNSGNNGNNTTPGDDGNHNTNPGDNGNHNTNSGNNGNNNGINNGTQNGNGNSINNGTQNGNNNGINNGTQNGNGNKTVNTNVTDNGQNNKQALPQTGNTKNDAAVAGLGLAGLLAMLGLGGLKKKRN